MSHATEKYITCPYNQSHSILAYRMQYHLHKCRKNYTNVEYGSCTHNSTHHIPKQELKYHEDHECPDRHDFQAMIAQFADTSLRVPIDTIELPVLEESWDNEPVNTFDPRENAKAKSLIRGVHCVPPSERKQFRNDHRKHVESSDDIETKTKLSAPKKPSTNKENGQMLPLRPPKEWPKGFNMGRGVKQPTDEASAVIQAPSHSSSSSSSSLMNLPAERPGNASNRQWLGMGRGRPIPPSESSSPPNGAWGTSPPCTAEFSSSPKGAWGNGRPKF
ncbi:gametocyte-specific factor 1 homolog isoform X2 [Frankliniella occidentalis]|nr:gametocyte-specific factor 1 homolog isoform X2 [Frankliniella occidentalis]